MKLKNRVRCYFLSAVHIALLAISSLEVVASNEGEDIADLEGWRFCVSCDGGGIRGVYPARFLSLLEDDLQKAVNGRVHLAECVDVFAGTSTGGLIAIALNIPNREGTSPKYYAQDVLDLYEKHGGELFAMSKFEKIKRIVTKASLVGSSYDRKNLETVVSEHILEKGLLDAIGKDSQFRFEKPFSGKVVIPAYDINVGKQVVFIASDEKSEYTFEDVAFATSAAPYYFDAYEKKNGEIYVDGGLVENNPALDAMLEGYKSDAKKITLLSIGTGEKDRSFNDIINRGALGTAKNVEKFISLMMSGSSKNFDRMLEQYKNYDSKLKYIRINSSLNDQLDTFEDVGAIPSLKRLAADEYANHIKELRKNVIGPSLQWITESLFDRRLKKIQKDDNRTPVLDLTGIPASVILERVPKLDLGTVSKLYLEGIIKKETPESYELLMRCLNLFNERGSVQFLSLSNNVMSYFLDNHQEASDSFLESIHGLNNLKTLILSDNLLTDKQAMPFIKLIKDKPSMIHLDLSRNEIRQVDFSSLEPIEPRKLQVNLVQQGADLKVQNLPEGFVLLKAGGSEIIAQQRALLSEGKSIVLH